MALKHQTFPMLILGLLLATVPHSARLLQGSDAMAQTATAEVAQAEPSFVLPDSLADGTQVRIDGDASMAIVNQSLQQAYQAKFANGQITLAANGSEAALAKLIAGELDLAALGRPLSDAEKAQGVNPVVLDREKIAIIVSEENPFSGDIGFAQFAQLFRGEISDWSQLGGPAGAIRFIDRPASSNMRQSLSSYPVFQDKPFEAGSTAQAIAQDNTAEVIKSLGKDGVGYAIYSQVKDLPGIKIIPMHKVLPDNPAYPYSQPRVYAYRGEPNAAVQSFLGLAQAPVGKLAIAQAEVTEAAALAEGQDPTGEAAAQRLAAAANAAPGAEATAAVPAPGTTDGAAADGSAPGADNATPAAAEGTAAPDAAATALPETISPEDSGDGTQLSQGEVDGTAADGATEGSTGLPWRGILPLAALAAGGGLLWWLAAAKDEEYEEADMVEGSPLDGSGSLDGGLLGASAAGASAGGSPQAAAAIETGEAMPSADLPNADLANGDLPNASLPLAGAAAVGLAGSLDQPGQAIQAESDGPNALEGNASETGAETAAPLAEAQSRLAPTEEREGLAPLGDAAAPGASAPGSAGAGLDMAAAGTGAAIAGGVASAAGAAFAAAAVTSRSEGHEAEESSIESTLCETRLFYPSEEFSRQAQIKSQDDYHRLYVQAKADPEAFWADLAEHELHWFEKWDKTLEWNPPEAKWFVGGKLNITYNCLDRHLETDRRNKPAILWEGEPGDARVLTYAQLHREVCLFANSLKKLGIGKGDVVGIYMPMVAEAAIAMLACARIGAPHSVVFGGFSAEALRDRLNDGQAKLVITADGGWRKDKIIELKSQVDQALENGACPSVENVLVVQRTRQPIAMETGRDHWWHDIRQTVPPSCPAEPMDSEDVLFILYTSGSTGKPKGVVHTTGGYNLYTHMTTKWIFDLREEDIYWCTADVGWITGHSYIVYGPLSNGATTVMYEGAPRPSNPGCFWDVVEKYKVSIFYTAPTAVRAFIKMGEELPQARDLSSLRLLGTVGEPINPEAWMWYHRVIGGERCPIVDTWWQTETGGIMITALPGAVPTKPGSAARPFPGIIADVVDREGRSVPNNQGGYLIIRHPWPSMIRGVYGDPERFRKTYWEQIPGQDVYFAGDGARIDEDGYFWVMGRVDDVISVSGHRLGTMEIESALVSHPAVAEAAVVGRPDELKGEEVFAFITLERNQPETEDLVQSIKAHVVQEIGALARPGEIKFTEALPKTRSGKIMRRLLRKIAAGEEISGDTSTLEDRSVLDKLRGET